MRGNNGSEAQAYSRIGAHTSGIPLIRSLALAFPENAQAWIDFGLPRKPAILEKVVRRAVGAQLLR